MRKSKKCCLIEQSGRITGVTYSAKGTFLHIWIDGQDGETIVKAVGTGPEIRLGDKINTGISL